MILLLLSLLWAIIPWSRWRTLFNTLMNNYPAKYWVDCNWLIAKFCLPTRWEIDDVSELNPQGWYLVLANHQSWLDIIVLGIALNRKIPILKFFMKKQLIWVPFLGLCCYALGFPFMGRYSKDYLKKHPEKKGKDIASTRKACEKFKNIPTSIINFCEGTRATPEKQARQASPFLHLLKPKAGGSAFVLSMMGEYLHQLLDVTIIYPQGRISFWQYFCGQVESIVVKIRLLPIQPELIGDYENDTQFRRDFQKWLNELWHAKDAVITQTLNTPTHGSTFKSEK